METSNINISGEHLMALSKAEYKILFHISQSKTTKEIAGELKLSSSTIKNHRHRICEKLKLQPVNNALLIFALKYKSDIQGSI